MRRGATTLAASVYLALTPVSAAHTLARELPPTASVQPVLVDRLVAVVGDRALMASDLRIARLVGSIPDGAATEVERIEQLVLRELMRLEVERFAVAEPSDAAVSARITQLRETVGDAAWQQEVRETGVTDAGLRRLIADDLRIAAYLDQRFLAAAQPTDVEVAQRAAADTGRTPTPAALDAARDAIVAERHEVLVSEWLTGLRRRAPVRIVETP